MPEPYGEQIIVEVNYPRTLLQVVDGWPPLCLWGAAAGGRMLESKLEPDTVTDRVAFDSIEAASQFMGETTNRFEQGKFEGDAIDPHAGYVGQLFRIIYQGKQAVEGIIGTNNTTAPRGA